MNRYITNPSFPKYDVLMSLIPIGEENARSMRELARVLSISCRDVRKIIENARRDGLIIASSDAGYYVPSCEEELVSYYRRTMYRVDTTLATLRPVEEIIDDVSDGLRGGVRT